ncbi:MAG TPA: hypothetical protein VNU46_08465 [Gemmatimonadaceae bacterium]|nr:hypothetical protein [Gemmatimonadaceae bacterium]
MNLQQRKTLDTFTRAITFLESNPPVLANASPGFVTQVQVLKTAIANINTAAPDRGSGKPAKTANQRAVLRHNLRVGQLYPIRRVARVLERTVAGMPHLVNIPGRSASTQSLLDAGKAAARDVGPYSAQFAAKGLSVDFLDQLNTAIQALENSDAANMAARMAAVGAQGQLTKSFQEGRDALTLIDTVIRTMCDADPTLGAATLAIWNTIVSPRSQANRTATSVANGTTTDVGSSVTGTDDTTTGSATGPATGTSGTGAATGATATGATPAPTPTTTPAPTTAQPAAVAVPSQDEAAPVAPAPATGGTSA